MFDHRTCLVDRQNLRTTSRYRVGLPGKSGVGGGILAIAPGKASIAVWSPGLDRAGNPYLGQIALEMLTKRMGWSIFGV